MHWHLHVSRWLDILQNCVFWLLCAGITVGATNISGGSTRTYLCMVALMKMCLVHHSEWHFMLWSILSICPNGFLLAEECPIESSWILVGWASRPTTHLVTQPVTWFTSWMGLRLGCLPQSSLGTFSFSEALDAYLKGQRPVCYPPWTCCVVSLMILSCGQVFHQTWLWKSASHQSHVTSAKDYGFLLTGHEYAAGNLEFAAHLDVENEAVKVGCATQMPWIMKQIILSITGIPTFEFLEILHEIHEL